MKWCAPLPRLSSSPGRWSPAAASAQTYPNKPITMICPFPPGGATDAISRIIQDAMSQSLGQQIVIENIGGAGGMIAAATRCPRRARRLHHHDPPGGAGGGHDALSESHVRRRKGFRPDRPHQHRGLDLAARPTCRRTISPSW